jgi:hypothetical protein
MEIEKQHRQPNPAQSASAPQGNAVKEKRIEFAIFLKVLIRCLENAHQESMLRQTRLVVMACIRGHDMGGTSFYSLEDAIELRLKRIVHAATFTQAKRYARYYLQRKMDHQARQFYAPCPFVQIVPTSKDSKHLEFVVTRIAQI